MNVAVIGLGYIGLPTALMLASVGQKIVGVDKNKALLAKLNKGELTFKEEGLQTLFAQAKGNVEYTDVYPDADIYLVTTPTPYDEVTKSLDSSYIISALEEILTVCRKGAIVAIESTISPGTIDRDIRPVITSKGLVFGEDIHIAHVPERIIPGNMIYELRHNSRVIGVDEIKIGEELKELYTLFCQGEIVITEIRTAEMSKVVENTFRDVNIAFANELAKLCEKAEINVHEVIRIANMHPRVNILSPGPGVGGHCISVDPWFLVTDFPDDTPLIHTARKVNDSMPDYTLKQIYKVMQENQITDLSQVGLYGLTYKENVDDTRESPTLQIIRSMQEHLAPAIKVYDPYISEHPEVELLYDDFEAFLADIKMVVILVGHTHLKENSSLLADKVVLDTKNLSEFDKAYKL